MHATSVHGSELTPNCVDVLHSDLVSSESPLRTKFRYFALEDKCPLEVRECPKVLEAVIEISRRVTQ